MKRIGVLFILSACVSLQLSATDILGGDISGTWTVAGSPYIIKGDVGVPENLTLTIKPGVTVLFDGHYRISVYEGDLFAVGKPDSMIVFSMAPEDTTGLVNGGEDEGGWNSLRFFYSSTSGDSSRLEYCVFEYCKVHEPVLGGRGVISTERFPRLLVANCIFRHNYSDINGVDCRLSDVVIRNNIFQDNHGNYLMATSEANPYFHDNEIRDNTFLTIFSVSSWTFPLIERNLIAGNQTQTVIWADGLKAAPVFRSNKILNNTITATNRYVLYLKSSEAQIENNLIANNQGRTIYCYLGNNLLRNNTIVNNDNEGGDMMYLFAEMGEFNGNIFWGNTGPIHYFQRPTEPAFKYNLIQGGTAGFTGQPFTGPDVENIDADPQFIDPTTVAGLGDDAESADFGLDLNSPAINRGDPSLDEKNFISLDVYGGERIKYGIIDVGAAENIVKNRNLSDTISSELYLFGDTVNVTGDVLIEDDVVLTIAGGTNMVFDGPYQIEVKGTLLADGRQDDPILFTVSDTSGFYLLDQDDGSWDGIYINNGTGSMDDNIPSLFRYCEFEYGKTFSNGLGGLLTLISIDNVKFEHCDFRYSAADNYYGAVLWANNAEVSFDHCSFSHNYEEVNYFYKSIGLFSNCTFSYNTGPYAKCAKLLESIYYSTNNLYRNNATTTYQSGVVVGASKSEIYLLNDVIVNNSCGNEGNLNLSSCIGTIVNSTIVNNHTSNSNFAGAICLTRTELEIYNSILYGNTAGSYHYSIFLAEENTDPDLYHCIMEGGSDGVRTYEGFSFSGMFEACLDGDPFFIDPTASSGSMYDATGSNWQLLDISPAINQGTPDTTGLGLQPVDFAGNPRIQNDHLDIGAFEKGGNPAEIVFQPEGGNLCTGDDHTLAMDYTETDTVLIRWKKDGTPITGASGKTLEIGSASLEDEGNYTCFIENSFGIVNTIPVYLSVKAPPEILTEPDLDWVEPKKPLSLTVFAEGSAPMFYRWQKDGVTIPGAIFPEYRFIPSDPSQEGSYQCIVDNVCGSDSTSPVTLYLAPQICMVTVDPESGKNQVVWEKNTTAPILAYNVYRESVAAGIYDHLATVPFDDFSVFTDTTADPTVQAYLYKITAHTASGEETDADLCRTHKTIHLLVSTNPELQTTQLAWDKYYGFEYQTYTIYRSSTGVDFDSIHSLASSLNSWTDPNPTGGVLYYRLSVERPEPCLPAGGKKKEGTGPYNHSLSNLDDNKLKATFKNPPDSILLSNQSVNENGIPGALVGRLSTIDIDSGDLHTYHLVAGTGDAGNSSFTIAGDLLLAAVEFDYETKDTYSVRIRSTDNGDNSLEQIFTISILDTEEGGGGTGTNPPSDLSLNNTSIAENNIVGALVGRLITTDQDTNDVFTYHLVSGTGDSDNGSFSLLGDLLLAAANFDFEAQSSYSIRIRVVDAAENSLENTFTISITDVDETVGISAIKTGELVIYPNPMNQSAVVVFPNPHNTSYRMRITDLTGKTVRMRENINDDKFLLQRQELGRGYYILELRGDRVFRTRLVIE